MHYFVGRDNTQCNKFAIEKHFLRTEVVTFDGFAVAMAI